MHALTQNNDFLGFDPSMKVPLIASSALHVGLFIILAVGVPFVSREPIDVSMPIAVELVTIDEITQTNRISTPAPKPEEPAPAPEPAQTKPEPPQMTSEAPPDLTVPTPPDLQEEETAQAAEPEPVPPPPAEEPEVEKPKPVKKVKPPPPKPEVTKRVKPQEKNDFASLLKNLTPDLEINPRPNEAQEQTEEAADPEAGQVARLADRLTVSEVDALRYQLSQCWNILAGAKYAEDLVVEVRAFVNPDRTLRKAAVLDQGRYARDSHFRAAADAALRALRNPRCSPLALPPDKYEEWKTTIIRFDPRDIL